MLARQSAERVLTFLPAIGIVVLFGTQRSSASVVYTFSGTTLSGYSETFQYTSRGFIDSACSANWNRLSNATDLTNLGPPDFGPHVTNGGLGDQVGTATGSVYMFPLLTLTTPGVHHTWPGWSNSGTLTVEVTPELSAVNAASHGFSPAQGFYLDTFQLAPGSLAQLFGSNDFIIATAVLGSEPVRNPDGYWSQVAHRAQVRSRRSMNPAC
jgi:hypothetical protein